VSVELYNHNGHVNVLFTDLVEDTENGAVQANQSLIIDQGQGMLLDPGGTMTYNELYVTMGRYFAPKELAYVFASHADPDIIASLPRWLSASSTRLLISRLWARFVPHVCPLGRTEGRIIAVPDAGGTVALGRVKLVLLPAHFLHAEGNLQVYDPLSRTLFSGDLGASMVAGERAAVPVTDLEPQLPGMTAFHRRYMGSRRIGQLWAAMVRPLDIDLVVPQHGAPIKGRAAVRRFIDWVAETDCGVDLMTAADYQVPTEGVTGT
jgi:flavorubredoxin